MRTLTSKLLLFAIALAVVTGAVHLRAQQLEPLESPPTRGTFWLVQTPAPYPFDPFYGQLPIYEIAPGIYLIDDSDLELLGGEMVLSGGGGMMLSSIPSPGGGSYTNGGSTNLFCNGPTNFTVAYTLGTNLWLKLTRDTNNVGNFVIHTSTTNATYDLFGTTNMNKLALPALSQTNWLLLVRATGTGTNFAWTNITPCEAYFELGTMYDEDGDGLTSAYESLVLHTKPDVADTDGDGISDGLEVAYGLNPLVADPPFTISITQPTPDSLF